MLCTNKKILELSTWLLNEKMLFKFDPITNPSTISKSVYSDIFIRLIFSIRSYNKSDAISYSFLSWQMLFPKPNKIFMYVDTRRCVTKAVIERQMFIRIFPYFFFSYIQSHFNSNHAFFSPSI